MLKNILGDDEDGNILKEEAMATMTEQFKPMLDNLKNTGGGIFGKMAFDALVKNLDGTDKEDKGKGAGKKKYMLLDYDTERKAILFYILDKDQTDVKSANTAVIQAQEISDPSVFIKMLLGKLMG